MFSIDIISNFHYTVHILDKQTNRQEMMSLMDNIKSVLKGMLFGLFGFATLPVLLVQSIIEMFG